MICKKSFCLIMDALDTYFNGEIAEAITKLGLNEWAMDNVIDNIVNALDSDVDAGELASIDDNCAPCGSYICEWLFGEGALNEICPTAADLYDYIEKRYNETMPS